MGLRFDILIRKGLDENFPLVDYLIDHPELYPAFCLWHRRLIAHPQRVYYRMWLSGRTKNAHPDGSWGEGRVLPGHDYPQILTREANEFWDWRSQHAEILLEKFLGVQDQVAQALGYIETPDEEYANGFVTPDGELSWDWSSWEDPELQELNDEIATAFEDDG